MGRWRALIPIALALLVAVLGSVLLYGWLQKQQAPPGLKNVTQADTVNVVVANIDLAWGTKITQEMLEVVPFFKKSLPAGYFAAPEEVAGRVLITAVKKNEPILEYRLASDKISAGGVSAVVKPGMRALSVSGNKVMGLAGFIRPGNRVDVLATIANKDAENGSAKEVTKTILENVLVLATGTSVTESPEGKPSPVDVYTLELTPEDGETLAHVATHGKLQFALRNVLDDEMVLTEGATIAASLASYRPPGIADFPEMVAASQPAAVEEKVEKKVVEEKVTIPPIIKVMPSPKKTHRVEIIRGVERTEVDMSVKQ